MTGIIYVATNKQNGKRYVGQTINFTKRLNDHKHSKQNVPFGNAIRKNGIEGFDFLSIRYNAEYLDFWESYWIEHLNTLHPNGYNLMTGGAAPKHSDETKKKISEAVSGPLHHYYGKHFSEEHRYKISKTNKNRIHKKGWYHTEETKYKIGIKHKGKKITEEMKKKLSEWMSANRTGENNTFYGKVHSEESRRKIGAYFKGKPWGENRRKAYERGVKINGLKKKEENK